MTAVAPQPPPSKKSQPDFDPDQYRMTIGEHLEELRWRVILGLIGFAAVLACCLVFRQTVFRVFCAPLYTVLAQKGLTPQLQYTELGEPFVVWIRVSMIVAAAVASPWIVYQLWQFVSAGLYPHERKYVTRYAPLSIVLLVTGMLFVYFLVLPWSIEFFIDFGSTIEIGGQQRLATEQRTPTTLPKLHGDPPNPVENEVWIDTASGMLKYFSGGKIHSVRSSSDSMLTPDIKLSDYISLVVGMLLIFGLSFQLPLVVMALARIGIIDVAGLKNSRRYVYFLLAIVACAITPGDVITASIALTLPLCLLYELGIWLAGVRPAETA